MNRAYRVVWNHALGVMQVASELTRAGQGGGASSPSKRRLARACLTALAAAACASPILSAACTPSSVQICGTSGGNGGIGQPGSGGAGGAGSNSGSNDGGAGGYNGSAGVDGQGAANSGGGGGGGISWNTAGGSGGVGGGNGGAGFIGSGAGGGGGGLDNGGIGGGGGGGSSDLGLGFGGGGGGGGGGLGGTISATATIAAGNSIVGGDGGSGNVGPSGFGGGGGGGAGVLLTGGTLTNLGRISGGNGGNDAGLESGGGGGGGGLLMKAGTALINSGTVSGGNGGSGNINTSGGGGGDAVAVAAGGASINNAATGTLQGGAGGNCDNSSACEGSAPGAAGGAGLHSQANLQLTNAGAILGGAGGSGLWVGNNGGNGGAALLSSGSNNVVSNTGTLNGGAGGAGSTPPTTGNALPGGNGGAGGAGADLSNAVLSNSGAITGGNGGAGGAGTSGGASGSTGAGGVGVIGRGNVTIETSGSISGGLSGDGVTRANAIIFSGGGNTLTLQNGYAMTGNVISTAGNQGDTLALGGDSTGASATGNGTFNVSAIVASLPASYAGTQYVGFQNFAKTGNSTWILTGSGANNGSTGENWTVTGGTLQGDTTALTGNIIFQPTAGATAGVVFDQGSGNANSLATGTYAGAISGNGSLTKIDDGTLILTGTHSYTGGTAIKAGTLALSGSGSISGSSGVNVAAGATFDISQTAGGASIASLDGSRSGATTSTVNLGAQTLTLTNASGTFAGQIIGSGGLTVSGGTETLSGFNSYTGATTINNGGTLINRTSVQALTSTSALNLDNGTLELQNASLTTSAPVTFGSGGGTFNITTTDGSNRALELDGLISGNGSLTFNSSARGTLTLTNGNNSYSGGTTIARTGSSGQGPALVVAATGALGSGDVTVGQSSTLEFAGSGNSTVSAGPRTINLTGGASNLFFQDHTTAGSAVIRVADNLGAIVQFSSGSDAGQARITVGAADQLNFDGGNAARATIENNGRFALTTFSAGASAANAGITNANGGVTMLVNADAGNATLTNAGSNSVPAGSQAANPAAYTGGAIEMEGAVTAANATMVNNAGGVVAIMGMPGDPAAPAIGSLSGNGNVLLGANYDANGNPVPLTLTLGALNRNDTIGGVISDDLYRSGSHFGDGLTKVGTGTLTLNGANTYTGLTEIAQGKLLVGDGAHPGASLAGDAQVDGGATLGGHGTIGGNVTIASGGHLAPGGSIGTLNISGNLTAAQGSQLDYAFGTPGADFQHAGIGDSVKVGGNLTLNGATLNVADAGGFGPGLYNLFRYGGTLTETNGGLSLGTAPAGLNLQLQNLTSQQQINLLNTTGVTLGFWNADGQASATQMGGGSGTWSATSPNWTDAAGALTAVMAPQPGFAIFGGTPGTVTVDNTAGSVSATGLQFATNGYTLSGGTLTLVGSNGTAPVIRVGDGSSAGAGMTATINDVIAGSAGLTKADLGTLILTGANAYTGNTTIAGGTLEIGDQDHPGASVAGDVRVGTSGTLRGHGTVGGNVVNDGTVRPGGSIGVLTVAGNYTQANSGTLVVDISPTGASQLKVGGTATLGGTLSLLYGPGTYSAKNYRVLAAGAVQGNFAKVTGNTPQGWAQAVQVGANGVDLGLSAAASPQPDPAPGSTVIEPTNATLFGALGSSAISEGQRVNELLLGRLADPCQDPAVSPIQCVRPDRQGWVQATGIFTRVGGNHGAPGYNDDRYGFLAGLDQSFGAWTAGVAGGYSHADVAEHDTGSKGSIDTLRVAGYGSRAVGPVNVAGAIGYAYDFLSSTRNFAGLGRADGDTHGQEFHGGVQAALPMTAGPLVLTPRAGLRYQYFHGQGFAETGPTSQNLTVAAQNLRSLQPYAGIAVGYPFRTQSERSGLVEARMGYAYETLDIGRVVAVTSADGTGFLIPGTTVSRGMLSAGLLVTLPLRKSLGMQLEYDALIRTGNVSAQAFKVAMDYRF